MGGWTDGANVDLVFDARAASAAALALRAAASTIEATTDARRRVATEAQRDWVGPARCVFDDELRRHVVAASALASACRSAALAIEAASEHADAERRRRDRVSR